MTKAEIDDIFGEFEIDEDYMIKTKEVVGLFVAVKEEEKKVEEAPPPVEEAPAEEEAGDDSKKKKRLKMKMRTMRKKSPMLKLRRNTMKMMLSLTLIQFTQQTLFRRLILLTLCMKMLSFLRKSR